MAPPGNPGPELTEQVRKLLVRIAQASIGKQLTFAVALEGSLAAVVAASLSYELLVHEYIIRLTLLMEGAVQDTALNAVQDKIEEACKDRKQDPCTVKPLGYHRGNDKEYHDACADMVNAYPGSDVELYDENGNQLAPSYDAASNGDNTLWEVKTDNHEFKSIHAWEQAVKRIVTELKPQVANAHKCNKKFYFRAGDQELINDIQGIFSYLNDRPDGYSLGPEHPCLQPIKPK